MRPLSRTRSRLLEFFKVNIATRVCLLFVKYVYVDEKPDSRGCESVNAVTQRPALEFEIVQGLTSFHSRTAN